MSISNYKFIIDTFLKVFKNFIFPSAAHLILGPCLQIRVADQIAMIISFVRLKKKQTNLQASLQNKICQFIVTFFLSTVIMLAYFPTINQYYEISTKTPQLV
jgi:hypothetical protein